jgi:Kef-type K+ transport system membrane component KefB
LLLTGASSETEERVFAVSALLLVGGVADALSVSALFGGLVAGVFWRYAGRHPRETISRDVLFVQHPLLVLVLLVAGARADLSPASLAFGAAYVVLRVVGQLAGGAVARRAVGVNAPRDLGLYLLPPGVFGVAFALNAASVVGADASVLLAAVVAGTIGCELVALLLLPRSVGE